MRRVTRARLVALVAVLASACGPLPRPFAPPPGAEANPLAEPEESLIVRVEDVDGVATPLADLIARAVARGLAEHNIPAAARGRGTSRYVLRGQARRNLDQPSEPAIVLIEWQLVDGAGDVVGLHTQGVEGPWERWEYGDPRLIEAVGGESARVIAGLIGDEAERPRLPPTAPTIGIGAIEGAPGDGNEALARAMRLALRSTQIRVVDDRESARAFLSGRVSVGPPADGRQPVEVDWIVTGADGRELARLTQSNTVPPGSLDGAWGRSAALVAAAAALDIERVMGTAPAESGDAAGR